MMSSWLHIIAAAVFMTGLLGGVHCAAMCGGIVVACSSQARGASSRSWTLVLAYNAGRISSYVAAGVLAGAMGQGAVALRPGPAAQPLMLAAAGASMLLLALYVSGRTRLVRQVEVVGAYAWRHIQPYSRWFLPANTVPRALGLGALWGWLPCGMVYGVLLTALATGDVFEGGIVMLAFGLGTLPNLLGLAFVTGAVRRLGRRPSVRMALAVAIAVLGAFALFQAAHATAISVESIFCATPAAHRH